MTPPTGTVTFLFTDIEGSTRRWDADPAAMSEAVARHDALVRAAIEGAGGYVFKTLGDAFCAAFADASAAVVAATVAQRAIDETDWTAVGGVRIRAAIHAGAADERDGDYFGPPLNRTARLMGVAHGGQTVLSRAARDLVGDDLPAGASLRDLGEHRLRDLSRSEHVFQLVVPGLPDDFPVLLSLGQRPNNLPVETASFVGRERELEALLERLPEARVLTLSGIGGTGKTRLALQLAAAALDDYPNGTWFVELAPLAAPELVASTVAAVLGVRELPGQTIEAALLDHLADKRLLLVLDNCEHVVEAAARLAEAIVRRCPNVRIVATSREALAIPGEHVFPVPPLGLPASEDDAPASIAAAEGVRLFVERAQAVVPRFDITTDNAGTIAELCRRLDGIPLAIELAAARTRMMSPTQILERLDQRFQLLTGGSRTAEPRQQTLRAAIAWSYDLLPTEEQALLQRLSVFRGGWALAAAAAVGADVAEDEWATLDLLTRLVDKSLVVATETDAGIRFGMLESVRDFAHEAALTMGGPDRPAAPAARSASSAPSATSATTGSGAEVRFGLSESVRAFAHEAAEAAGTLDGARARHRAYYAALVAELEPHLNSTRGAEALVRFDLEHDNFRAALDTAQGDAAAEALRIVALLWRFWELRSILTEGRSRLEHAIAAGGDADRMLRGRVRYGLAVLLMRLGDPVAARRELDACVADVGDGLSRAGMRHIHNLHGLVAILSGDLAEARTHYVASLALAEEETGPERTFAIANELNNVGIVDILQDEPAAAQHVFQRALDLLPDGADNIVATLRFNKGSGALVAGDVSTAAADFGESLARRRVLNDPWGILLCVAAAGWVAAARGEAERAATLLSAAEAKLAALGRPFELLQQRCQDDAHARVAAALDPATHAAATAVGRAMAWDEAMARASEG